jgi:hypothetical protein
MVPILTAIQNLYLRYMHKGTVSLDFRPPFPMRLQIREDIRHIRLDNTANDNAVTGIAVSKIP